MKQFKTILPHLTVIAALVVTVLLIFNYFNPYMEFLSHAFSQLCLLALCLLALATSLLSILSHRK